MNILIIAPYYTPDLGPSAPLFSMLSKALLQRGHQVTVVAMVPHYPSGQVLPAYRGKWIQKTVEQGVKVVRIGIPSIDRKKLSKRLVQFAYYQIGATLASFNQKFDAAIITAPFVTSLLPFIRHGIMRHKPIIMSIHDVYPDVGIKLGVFKHKLLIATVGWLESFCLKHSTCVRILSDSFRPGVRALGVPDNKITIIYDWVDTELIQPFPKDNAFSRENHLSDKFVVLYAGNIGLSQGLEHILAAAELLSDQDNMRFVFVGDGAGKEYLQTQSRHRKLSNVQFIPFQPRERLPEVLASADISLIILRRGIGFDSLPSKTYSIMASGRPIVVSIDEESETWKLINKADAGVWVPPENPSRLADAILTLKQDTNLSKHLGHNGRIWAEQNHSPQNAAAQFEMLINKAVAK